MPTKEAVLKTLAKIGISSAVPSRKLYWTSLREEPVIYVKGILLYIIDRKALCPSIVSGSNEKP